MHILHVNDLDIGRVSGEADFFFRADLRVNIGFIRANYV